ncbi:MAG: extracellular solute-binding protein [Eubacteriales bacterium]|nr:extracellular solute-binding protein [Eubacteriales bacterium]
MKKLVALLTALTLLIGLTPIVAMAEEVPTFTIAIVRHTLDKGEDIGTKYAAQKAFEKTGVKIEWLELESGTETERANVMLASGDLPDAFLGVLSEDMLVKNLDSFVSLSDLIDENAPNIKAQYDQYPKLWEMLTMTDGSIYSLAVGDYSNPDNQANGIQFINKAWLDKLGLAIPTTTEELYNVLVAVRDGDPNGNGLADELPLIFCENNWAAHFTNFMGSWGFVDYYKIENGQFIFTPTLPEFRSCLEFYHKLASEGLLDVEGFTQTNQQYYAKLKENIGVSYCGWTPASNFDPEIAAEYVAMAPVQASDYPEIKPVVSGENERFTGNRFGFAITTSCKDPAKLLQWFDAQNADTATKMEWKYGEAGLLWEMDENGQAWALYPDTVTTDFTRENMKYTYGLVNRNPCLIMPNELEQNDPVKAPEAVVRLGFVNTVKDSFAAEVLPIRSVPEDKTSERALVYADLKAYLDSFVADCVVNGVDDAKWQTHLSNVDGYGAAQWTQWYQDFLDGKF